MSKRNTVTDIPVLEVADIRLLSVSYRISSNSLASDTPSTAHMEGRIRFRPYGVSKKSFKVTMIQELRTNGIVCRMRHQARLASDNLINPQLLKDESFQHQIIRKLIPFHSELFAILTGKSFTTPIVASGELGIKKETPE